MSTPAATTADVIVVGAGPGGSATAAHLAKSGLSVVVLEKAHFPRDKVCGDGLTPRAVAELARLGVDTGKLGWIRNRGLRVHVGNRQHFLDWPDLTDFPPYGFGVRRRVFDQFLAQTARLAGADVRFGVRVDAPWLRRGRLVGVIAKDGQRFEAPVVVAADGGSSRLGVAMGLHRIESRPVGVALRTYYRSPRSDDEWMDSWLELWDGPVGRSHLLPGYGWGFPLGDGTVNVGMGLPDAHRFRDTDLRDVMGRWLRTMPEEYGLAPANQAGPVQGAALPMGFNRAPLYSAGLLLVGDAAGLVNPFTGEGISYAMESGRFAAEHIVEAASRGLDTRAGRQILGRYEQYLREQWGRYFGLGNLFGRIIAHPSVMRLAAHYGLPIPGLRMLTHRMLSHLTDHPAHDAYDRIIAALLKLAPRA